MHYKRSRYAFLKWAITLIIVACANGLSASKPNPTLYQSADKSIFIDVVTSKSTVFVGETLTVQYLLYYSTSIVDPQNDLDIKFKDCYVEIYPVTPIKNRLINGKNYHVILLEKALLIPQFEGTLNIPVINVQLKVNQPTNDFFGTEQPVTKEFSSPSKQINVLALPSPKNPVPFMGAVGRFKINYKFTKSDKATNQLGVDINITGEGDTKFAHWLPPALPPGIDIFNINNKETNELIKNDIKINHKFSFDLVANFRGSFTIPKITFLAFDPDSSKYVKYETSVYEWKVDKGPELPETLVKRKSPLKNMPSLYTKIAIGKSGGNQLFFGSKAYYFFIICGTTLLFIGRVNIYNTKIKESNPALYYFKTAKKQAINKIQKLKINADDIDDTLFYKKLDEILQTYICHKTGITFQEFSIEQIINRLREIQVPDDIQVMVSLFIKQQYTKRFSPGIVNNYSRDTGCSQLLQIVKSLDIYIK